MDLARNKVRAWALVAGLWAMAAVAPAQARPPIPTEQKQQMREQMREHWQQMPPDQRGGRRQEIPGNWQREGPERWQPMPSGERQRLREELRDQRGGGRGRW